MPKPPGKKQRRLDTVLSELESEKTTAQHTLGYREWVARLLQTNLRVYRINVEVEGCSPALIQSVESTLNSIKLPLLRVDPVSEGVYRFNTLAVTKHVDLHDSMLGVRAHLLRAVKDQGKVKVLWLDVTQADGEWQSM